MITGSVKADQNTRRVSRSSWFDEHHNINNNDENYDTVSYDNEKEVANISHHNLIFRWIIFFGKKVDGGNPARDHLANERTILAYIRTALNMVIYGLILSQLGKYIIVSPINGLKVTMDLTDEQMQTYKEMKKMLDCVYKFSRPLSALVFSMSLATLVFGGIRYLRIMQLLFSDHDVFESGLLFNLVIFLGVIPIIVIAFVYAYKL